MYGTRFFFLIIYYYYYCNWHHVIFFCFDDCRLSTGSPCDRLFRSDVDKNGTFTSPGYPAAYSPSMNCNYEFRGHGRERVQIIFTDFVLHHPHDDPSEWVALLFLVMRHNSNPFFFSSSSKIFIVFFFFLSVCCILQETSSSVATTEVCLYISLLKF